MVTYHAPQTMLIDKHHHAEADFNGPLRAVYPTVRPDLSSLMLWRLASPRRPSLPAILDGCSALTPIAPITFFPPAIIGIPLSNAARQLQQRHVAFGQDHPENPCWSFEDDRRVRLFLPTCTLPAAASSMRWSKSRILLRHPSYNDHAPFVRASRFSPPLRHLLGHVEVSAFLSAKDGHRASAKVVRSAASA